MIREMLVADVVEIIVIGILGEASVKVRPCQNILVKRQTNDI